MFYIRKAENFSPVVSTSNLSLWLNDTIFFTALDFKLVFCYSWELCEKKWKLGLDFMEAQNRWEWYDVWRSVTWSTHPAQARPPTAGCPGSCLGGFWISPRGETLQHLWETCASAHPHSQSVSWHSEGAFCVSAWAHCFVSCHWAPQNSAWFHLLYTLPSRYLYTLIRSPLSLLTKAPLVLNSPSSPSFSSQESCFSSFTIFTALC